MTPIGPIRMVSVTGAGPVVGATLFSSVISFQGPLFLYLAESAWEQSKGTENKHRIKSREEYFPPRGRWGKKSKHENG